MSYLFLQPLDVWLFRDGRPFDVGLSYRAESLFPPYPTSIQGAIRSHQLVLQHIPLHEEARKLQNIILDTVGTPVNYEGTEYDYKGLLINGPHLARIENNKIVRYFPQPADAVSVDKTCHKLKLCSSPKPKPSSVITNIEKEFFLLGLDDQPAKGESGLWISEEELSLYFNGEEITGILSKDLFETENRVGISMDNYKNVTQEGGFYEVEYIRPSKNVGLIIEVNGERYSNWPKSGIMRIGGENHAAQFEIVKMKNLPSIPNPLPKRFRMYFATPTFFEGGWRPKTWNKFFNGEVLVRAAAIGRYQSIGGFDYAIQSHKPSLRFVPAGSVYYFENDGNVSLKTNLVQNAITDFGAEIGFGQIIISQKGW